MVSPPHLVRVPILLLQRHPLIHSSVGPVSCRQVEVVKVIQQEGRCVALLQQRISLVAIQARSMSVKHVLSPVMEHGVAA